MCFSDDVKKESCKGQRKQLYIVKTENREKRRYNRVIQAKGKDV